LLTRFSPDPEKAGIEYETTRRKLIRFFSARSVDSADTATDETINRVARRIDEGKEIDNLVGYFYGVARKVFQEILKERERDPVPLEDAPQALRQKAPEPIEPDQRLRCFDHCLETLAPESRLLILEYYEGEGRTKIEHRQDLADRLRIPLNALRIRVHRIRVSLEQCIQQCLGQLQVSK
jgi:DNA-directed RNA polymerase specialized sigma24 family protein